MTEEVTTPGEQINSQQQESTDWESRYRGSSAVINRLTAERDEIKKQRDQALADLEQARAQISLKDTEKSAAITERDKQLNDIVQAKQALESELGHLRPLEMKLKVAKKIGRPDLMQIADTIPSVNDETALEELMKGLVSWGDAQVREREKQLLSGITPPTQPTAPAKALPTIEDVTSWQQYVNSAGDPAERQKRFDQWREVGLASMK
jgi:hypothetical protein